MNKLKELEKLIEEERKCFSLLEKAVELSFGIESLNKVFNLYHELRNKN